MAYRALLHFNGVDGSTTITDAVGVLGWSVGAGAAQLDTAQFKFGSASCLFDASNDYVNTSFGGFSWTYTNFTIDCFVRFSSVTGTHDIFGVMASGGLSEATRVTNNGNGNGMSWKVSYTGLSANLSQTGSKTSWNANQWYHIALVYDVAAGAYYGYVDGVLDATMASATAMSGSRVLVVGATGITVDSTDGWIDEWRLTDTCEFPGGTTFTPTTVEYSVPTDFTITPVAGTLALTGQSPLVAVSKMPLVGTLVLSGIAPVVTNTSARLIAPGTATLGLSGTLASLRDRPYPGTADLTMQGYAPLFTVIQTTRITPNTGELSLDTRAPVAVRGMTGEAVLRPYSATGALQTSNSFAGAPVMRKYDAVGYGQYTSAPVLRKYRATGTMVGSFIGAATLRAYRASQITATVRLRKYQAAGSLSAAVAEVYRTHTMNTVLNAVTEYSNYHFNSFAEIGGVWYGAGPSGLVKLEGVTDAGANINWQVRTGQTDDKQVSLKRLPEVVLGLRASGPVRVRVYPDDNQYFDYVLPNVKTTTIRQHRVKPGKGMRSRYYAIELQGMVNSAIELDSLQMNFTPTTSRLG